MKSNAIVYCGGGRTLGIGAGQMSRVDSTRHRGDQGAARRPVAGGLGRRVRRVLPVPRRARRRRRQRRGRGDPAGRQPARRRGDRGGRRARHRDGVHRHPPLPPLKGSDQRAVPQIFPARHGSRRSMARLRNAGAGRRMRRHVGLGEFRLPQARRHLTGTATTTSTSPATHVAHAVDVDTQKQRRRKTRLAWGGGWGRTVEKENGDTDSIFFIGVQRFAPQAGIQPRLRVEHLLGPAQRRPGRARLDGVHHGALGHRQRLAVSRRPAAGLGALSTG